MIWYGFRKYFKLIVPVPHQMVNTCIYCSDDCSSSQFLV